MSCRINVFSGLKRERSPRENPPKCDLGGFSRGDLSPRQAKIRQTGGEKAMHEKCRTFVWRGERSPCENTKKSPFGGFSRGAFSPFRPENTIIRHGTNPPPYNWLWCTMIHFRILHQARTVMFACRFSLGTIKASQVVILNENM